MAEYGAGFGASLARSGANMYEMLFKLAQAQEAARLKQAQDEKTAQADRLNRIISILPQLKNLEDYPDVIASIMGELGVKGDPGQIRRTADVGRARRDYFKYLELAKNSPDPMIRRQALQGISFIEKNFGDELGIKTDLGIVQGQDPRDLALALEPVTYQEVWRRKFQGQAQAMIEALIENGRDPDEAVAWVNRIMGVTIPWEGSKMTSETPETRIERLSRAQENVAKAQGQTELGYKQALNNFIKVGGEISSLGAAVKAFETQLGRIQLYNTSKNRAGLLEEWARSGDPVLNDLAKDIPTMPDLRVYSESIADDLRVARGKLRTAWETRDNLVRQFPQLKERSTLPGGERPTKQQPQRLPAPDLGPTPAAPRTPKAVPVPVVPRGKAFADPLEPPKAVPVKPTRTPAPKRTQGGLMWKSPVTPALTSLARRVWEAEANPYQQGKADLAKKRAAKSPRTMSQLLPPIR